MHHLTGSGVLRIAALLLVLCLAAAAGCAAKTNVAPVTVAVYDWPASAALYVAEKKGFFKAEKLDVKFVSYDSGKLALDDVLAGKADFATTGDTPIAAAVLQGRPLAVVATIAQTKHPAFIVARKDRGISDPVSLKGKKIGYMVGTGAEFYLYLYLTTSYIGQNEVQLVNLSADRIVDALVNGEVDAVSVFPAQTSVILASLGSNALTLEDNGIYTSTWDLAVTGEYASSNPETISRFLRAVVRANRFLIDHPDEARSLSSTYINAAGSEWEDYLFDVSLEQGLLLTMEEEARWMIKESADPGREIPNFLDYIYANGLKTVEPTSVRVVGR